MREIINRHTPDDHARTLRGRCPVPGGLGGMASRLPSPSLPCRGLPNGPDPDQTPQHLSIPDTLNTCDSTTALDRLEARPPYRKYNNQQQPQLYSRIERVATVASPSLEIPVDILGLETPVRHSFIVDHHDTPVS